MSNNLMHAKLITVCAAAVLAFGCSKKTAPQPQAATAPEPAAEVRPGRQDGGEGLGRQYRYVPDARRLPAGL